jgi:division/cell wall cluster transcriptional repressor MraZ
LSGRFYGAHERKLDYKGRLGIPDDLLTAGEQEWRRAVLVKESSELEDAAGKRPSFVGIWDIDSWTEILDIAQTQLDTDQIRRWMDQRLSDAATVDVDAAKRITVPDRLLQYASIDRQSSVRVLGVVDHMEIWSPAVYDAHIKAGEREEIRVPSIADIARRRIREAS